MLLGVTRSAPVGLYAGRERSDDYVINRVEQTQSPRPPGAVATTGVRLPAQRHDRPGLVRTERGFGEDLLLSSTEGVGGGAARDSEPAAARSAIACPENMTLRSLTPLPLKLLYDRLEVFLFAQPACFGGFLDGVVGPQTHLLASQIENCPEPLTLR